MSRRVPVFFYGSFMNLDVLKEVDVVPERHRVACLPGWDIRIAPLATLEPSDRGVVYGIVADCTHAEIERLYGQDWVESYLPEAVLVQVEGSFLPALTYVKWEHAEGVASQDYVERIAVPAQELGFPSWYVERIRSFL